MHTPKMNYKVRKKDAKKLKKVPPGNYDMKVTSVRTLKNGNVDVYYEVIGKNKLEPSSK